MSPMLPLFVLLLLPSLPLVTCDDDPTMQSLMTLVQQQAASIQTLQATVASLQNGAQQSQLTQQTVQTLQTKVTSLESRAEQSLGTDQTLQTKVATLESSAQTLQAKVTSLENSAQQSLATEQQHTGQINAINTRLNTQVYFNAHMSQYPVNIGTNNGPIMFDAVTSNVGNGYNPQTGVFTAPVTGTYVVYTQMMKESNQGFVTYVIDKTGTVVCRNSVDTANDFDKSSCLATVHLQKGETVIVRRDYGNGQQLHGYWYCAFSGVLVSADAS